MVACETEQSQCCIETLAHVALSLETTSKDDMTIIQSL